MVTVASKHWKIRLFFFPIHHPQPPNLVHFPETESRQVFQGQGGINLSLPETAKGLHLLRNMTFILPHPQQWVCSLLELKMGNEICTTLSLLSLEREEEAGGPFCSHGSEWDSQWSLAFLRDWAHEIAHQTKVDWSRGWCGQWVRVKVS